MIGQYVLAAIACLFLLAWVHSMDVAQRDGRPSRRQIRQWRKERK